jgi:hypothetical protein
MSSRSRPFRQLSHMVCERSDSFELDLDDIVRLQRELGRRHQTGAGQEHDANWKLQCRKQAVDEIGD